MTKITRKTFAGLLVGALAFGLGIAAWATQDNAPGSWVSDSAIQPAVGKRDSKGLVPMEQIGYETFILEADSAKTLVLDRNGDAPKRGILHKACITEQSATSDTFKIWDSSTTATLTDRVLVAPENASDTLKLCFQYDRKFYGGLVVENPSAAGYLEVIWTGIGTR